MPALRKCSGCGAVVPERAIGDGRALLDGKLIYCEECALLIRDPSVIDSEEAYIPEPDAAEATDATVELSVERLQQKLDKRRKQKRQHPEGEAQQGGGITAVIIGVIVVAAAILAVLFFRR